MIRSKLHIESRLGIEARLLNIQEFQKAQIEVIRSGFLHLEEATARIGRKDWILLFMGQMVSLLFTLALSGTGFAPDSRIRRKRIAVPLDLSPELPDQLTGVSFRQACMKQ